MRAVSEIASCCFILLPWPIQNVFMFIIQILNLDMPIAEKSIKNKVIFYNSSM